AWRGSACSPQHSPQRVDAGELSAGAAWSLSSGMTPPQGLATSLQDAAWSQLTDLLSDTAAGAGRSETSPGLLPTRGRTARRVALCGHWQPLARAERLATGSCWGLVLDRDENASRNRLRRGQPSLAWA